MKTFIASMLSAEETDILSHLQSPNWLQPSEFALGLLIRIFTASLLFCSFQHCFIVLQPAGLMVLSFVLNHRCLNTMALIQSSNWQC